MSDLGRDSKALLAAASGGDDPSPEDRMRVRRRLAQLGVGVAVTAATSGTAAASIPAGAVGGAGAAASAPAMGAAAVGASSFGVVTAKIVAAIVLVAAGAGAVGAVHVYESRRGAHESLRVALPVTRDVAPPAAAAQAAAVPIAIPVAEAPKPTRSPAGAEKLMDRPTVTHPSTLEAETVLLRDAELALRAGDAERALELLDEHGARFAGGVLSEECAAERVLVLCALGRVSEARANARLFLRESPRSPLAERVRTSCAGDAP